MDRDVLGRVGGCVGAFGKGGWVDRGFWEGWVGGCVGTLGEDGWVRAFGKGGWVGAFEKGWEGSGCLYSIGMNVLW